MKKKIPSWRKLKKIDLGTVDKQSKKVETATAKHAHKFLVSRLENLQLIRRHLIAWLLLLIILIGLNAAQVIFNQRYVSTPEPAVDAAYGEGVLGPLDNLNPLFAASNAEVSASRLMFSSLLAYDTHGRLQGDAAEAYTVSDNGKIYTVTIRPGQKWHDGHPLTAEDVVYTVQAMQNPLSGARQSSSWQGIKAEASGKQQVTFTLPTSYAPFASALTFPIVPSHLLSKVPPQELQENNFNNHPIGSGPFKYVDLQNIDASSDKKALQTEKNEDYWDGPPKLSRFSLYVYDNRDDLVKGIQRREINAASGVNVVARGLHSTDVTLNNGVFAIFRTDAGALKDKAIRKTLVQSIDREKLRKQLGATKALEGPIINNQTPLANQITQPVFDPTTASQQLDAAGWVKNSKGIREKSGQTLELRVVSVDTANYKKIVKNLTDQWRKLGIKTQTQLIDPEQIQQIILQPRAYDVLVYELSMGGDPDSYAFWHSSQISSSGLNFANYTSPSADDALITARGRSSMALRDPKYATFARRWVEDVPALALYRSSLRYTVTDGTNALQQTDSLVSPTDRFYNVSDWSAEQSQVYNTP